MDSSATTRAESASFPCGAQPRGVGWVLRWAAALAVLWFTGCVLAEYAYSLAVERTLARAARAGALEATLPRATCQTVSETVKRRLANRAAWAEHLTLSVQRNGAAVSGALRAAGGDRMGVTLAVPARMVVPQWLSTINVRTSESQIEVRAERAVPGRGWDGPAGAQACSGGH